MTEKFGCKAREWMNEYIGFRIKRKGKRWTNGLNELKMDISLNILFVHNSVTEIPAVKAVLLIHIYKDESTFLGEKKQRASYRYQSISSGQKIPSQIWHVISANRYFSNLFFLRMNNFIFFLIFICRI